MFSVRFLDDLFPVGVYIVTNLTLNFVICSVVINKRFGIHKQIFFCVISISLKVNLNVPE